MAVRFILMMALMMIALADPVPDTDVRVQFKAAMTAGAEYGSKRCWFGANPYPVGAKVKSGCKELSCENNGEWTIKEKTINDCDECQVDGDPHIHPFDQIEYNATETVKKYILRNVTGEFSIAQPGFDEFPLPLFGIKGEFEKCNKDKIWESTCIKSITYYEPGIVIQLAVDDASSICSNTKPDNCDIQVVSGTPPSNIGFSKDRIPPSAGQSVETECVSIVGSKGFSMSLCTMDNTYPNLFVWAMPTTLKHGKDSYLHGLCNTYTGKDVTYLQKSDGSTIHATKCLTYHTSPEIEWRICDEFAKSWRYPFDN